MIQREVHEEVIPREEITSMVVQPARDVSAPAMDKGKGVIDVGVNQGDTVQEDATRGKDITSMPSKGKSS